MVTEKHLKNRADKAHVEYQAASVLFDSLLENPPDSPAGILRVQQAAASREALARFIAAMERYHRFQRSAGKDSGIMNEKTRSEISGDLKAQLGEAEAAYAASKERFDRLGRGEVAITSFTNQILIFKTAENDLRNARLYYKAVLKRFADFTIDDTVPAEVRPPK